jgi:hypothetical protein
VRVFYDVREGGVEVLAIVPKSEAESLLKKQEKQNEEGSFIRSKRRSLEIFAAGRKGGDSDYPPR